MFQAKWFVMSSQGNILKSLATAAMVSLAGCGGGGVTPSSGGGGAGIAASPYSLFSSTYVAYTAQTPKGAWLHSIQAGDVYTGYNGNYTYGNYSSSQSDINRTGLYTLQFQGKATAPTTAADYTYIALLAPASGTFDISAATNLVIQMGNTVTPDASHGHANVFTIDLHNATATTVATNDCAANVTLSVVGNNVTLTALGVRTYVLPISSFTCSVGNLTNLQSGGITTVAVKVVGNNNPNVVASEYNTIAVGTIGFTSAITAADQTALAL